MAEKFIQPGGQGIADGRPDEALTLAAVAGHGEIESDLVRPFDVRGLVGGGSSQVGVTAALRARDAARPTDADIAAAETELVVVRRGWVPREELPRGGPRR